MQINEVCDRCGKVEELQISNKELIAKIKTDEEKKIASKKIAEFIKNYEGPIPDVVVITANKTVYSMDNLCTKKAGTKSSCLTRVMSLIQEMFLLNRVATKND